MRGTGAGAGGAVRPGFLMLTGAGVIGVAGADVRRAFALLAPDGVGVGDAAVRDRFALLAGTRASSAFGAAPEVALGPRGLMGAGPGPAETDVEAAARAMVIVGRAAFELLAVVGVGAGAAAATTAVFFRPDFVPAIRAGSSVDVFAGGVRRTARVVLAGADAAVAPAVCR